MTPIINQFNRFALNNKSIIQKALSSAVGVGAALIPQNLEEQITDTVIRLSPELAMLTPKDMQGAKTHEFNRLIQRPAPGGAMGENATTPTSNSKTARDSVELKIIRRKGKVTNFLNDTSRKYIDAASYEMENHLQAHILDLINYIKYGNKDSNAYEFDGIDKMISTWRRNFGGTKPTSLDILDYCIDRSNRRGGARHRRAFLMSPEMLSKFSQLLTNVRLNQGLSSGGMSQVDVGGGWRLNAYRDIPIIETSSNTAMEQMDPTIILATGGTTGGSLVDDTYYFRIAPITYDGEQQASAEQNVTLSGGGSTQKIKITLSDIHKDAGGAINTYAYKIYAGLTSGTHTLLKIVPAYVYDAEGTPTGYNGITGGNEIYITTMTPGADVPAHMAVDVPMDISAGVGDEIVALWDLDPIQGLGKLPFTNVAGDQFNGLVTTRPLAEVDDYIQFLVKSYAALTPAFESTSVWVRRIRSA
jgi:hypothetical protein